MSSTLVSCIEVNWFEYGSMWLWLLSMVFQVLVLLSLVAASSSYPATSGDVPSYYPCDAVQIEGGLKVDCPFYNMPELVRVAFRTNAPNKGIKYLGMHSDFEGTVMDYLSDNDLLSGSYDTLSELVVSYSSEVTFPKLLSKLRVLDTLYLDHVAVANPAAGSMNLASPKLMKFMSISYAPLYNFEAGVFPGNCQTQLWVPMTRSGRLLVHLNHWFHLFRGTGR